MSALKPLKMMFTCIVFLSFCQAALATPISTSDVITNWTSDGSPVDGVLLGNWTTSSGDIVATSNHAGSLTSDVSANSDFSFSVNSLARDNDTFGLVWGFQDLANHYRFSWAQDWGENGTGGAGHGVDGFKIIKEVGGISNVLFSSNTEYVQNQTYDLRVDGTVAGFTVQVENLSTSTLIFNESITDTTFASGSVGIHELYQENGGNVWSNFDLDTSTSVPEPSMVAIFASGMLLIGIRRRMSKPVPSVG
ncbi:PEP-CTERM sorting domain-containing protein [Pseudomonadales bacterium]|nr:PEP-CTERM sorting domain-containing protein [Pseudomonadales bacterium]